LWGLALLAPKAASNQPLSTAGLAHSRLLAGTEIIEVFSCIIPRETLHNTLVIITFAFSFIKLFTTLLLLTDDARFPATMCAVIGLDWFELKFATILAEEGL
jgi:hypothetical protein